MKAYANNLLNAVTSAVSAKTGFRADPNEVAKRIPRAIFKSAAKRGHEDGIPTETMAKTLSFAIRVDLLAASRAEGMPFKSGFAGGRVIDAGIEPSKGGEEAALDAVLAEYVANVAAVASIRGSKLALTEDDLADLFYKGEKEVAAFEAISAQPKTGIDLNAVISASSLSEVKTAKPGPSLSY